MSLAGKAKKHKSRHEEKAEAENVAPTYIRILVEYSFSYDMYIPFVNYSSVDASDQQGRYVK
jgi:hypothetical protein